MSKHKICFCSDCSHMYQSCWSEFMFSKQVELTAHTQTENKWDSCVCMSVCLQKLIHAVCITPQPILSFFIFLHNVIPERLTYSEHRPVLFSLLYSVPLNEYTPLSFPTWMVTNVVSAVYYLKVNSLGPWGTYILCSVLPFWIMSSIN